MPSRPTGPRPRARPSWRPRSAPPPHVDAPTDPAVDPASSAVPGDDLLTDKGPTDKGPTDKSPTDKSPTDKGPTDTRPDSEADDGGRDSSRGSTALRRVRERRGFRRDTPYTPPSWWLFLRRVGTAVMSFGGPRLRAVVQWLLRAIVRGVGLWSNSLQVRVVSSTIVLGLAATSVIGVVLTEQVSSRLLEARREQAFRDASRATAEFQRDMSSYAGRSSDTRNWVYESLTRIQSTGGDSAAGVLLLRAPGTPPTQGVTDLSTISPTVVPDDLRARVQDSPNQQSRLIELHVGGRTEPGLVVGSQVTLPRDTGLYELYFVLSLEPEQQSLTAIQRALLAGMVALVLLLSGIAWLVSRLVVSPVKEAARVADRLSSGSLDERMNPLGRDEIARLARSFNEMADSLQEQIEAMEELSRLQRRFVSDVSHELRTPLTTIRMAAEVIDEERGTFPPAVARSSELLATQLDRFEALLADLLEISRLDAGAAALDAEPIDLGAVVRQVLELTQPLAEAKQTVVRGHGLNNPAMAEADQRRVERIVRNLVANAIEHSESNPVDVYVEADDRTAAVLVVDQGIGLRPGDAEHVFDRFWRADPARARTIGGTGLGLAISKEDALLHGGSLRAWGEPGKGARFLLCLPSHAGQLPGRSPLSLTPPGVLGEEDWTEEPGDGQTTDVQTRILTEIAQLRPVRRDRAR